MKLKYLILDVDGVLNTGQFHYTEDGKTVKVFGAHDSDGLKMIKHWIEIRFISADWRGFGISKRRIYDDMGYDIVLVPQEEREEYIRKLGFDQTVYMADGYWDAPIMRQCAYSIAPASARIEARDAASHVTPSRAAEGAVLDACLWLKDILKINA